LGKLYTKSFFLKKLVYYQNNSVQNFKESLTDFYSSTPKRFGQTLCEIISFLQKPFFHKKEFNTEFQKFNHRFEFLDLKNLWRQFISSDVTNERTKITGSAYDPAFSRRNSKVRSKLRKALK
jgi:hypothetical protein